MRVLHLGAEERGRVEASVGLWGLKVLCRGSLMPQLPQQHIGAPQKVTAPQGLSWGQGVAPHLETPSFRFCAPRRLWAAVIHQAVSGRRGQERRRRRVALAGEPPCPGPGPRVRGFAHLSQLDGVRSSLLHPSERNQVGAGWEAERPSGLGPSFVSSGLQSPCLSWQDGMALGPGPGLHGWQTPQDGA